MNVVIIGSGGRENAIAWSISKSPKKQKLFIIPGNGGTERYGKNIKLNTGFPFTELIEFCKAEKIDLVVVGPEIPLVEGIVDILARNKIAVFGPSQKASQLEGSKAFMKEFLKRRKIPTAEFMIFNDPDKAIDYIKREDRPFVVKTDGLAAGKGAIVNKNIGETINSVKRIMVNKEFGKAGDIVILEELLEGTEVSVFIVSDGNGYKWLASAQDHKRIFDNDEGPNTGGMGAYSPAPFIDAGTRRDIEDKIVKPTIEGMRKEGYPYSGVLYLGLMLTASGPAVIEYNIRLGDPEAQAIIPLLKTDFLEIIEAVNNHSLGNLQIDCLKGSCTAVVIASGGYPDKYEKGIPISGDLTDEKDIYVFHAGTKFEEDGSLVTDGGRALCISAIGSSLKESIEMAYAKVKKIIFKDAHYRNDIGKKGLKFTGE